LLIGFALRWATLDVQSITSDEAYELAFAWLSESIGGARSDPLPAALSSTTRCVSRSVSERGQRAVVVVTLRPANDSLCSTLGGFDQGQRSWLVCRAIDRDQPFFVWYSQELRMYGLYIFLAAASMYHFFEACDTDRRVHRWAFVTFSVLGMYTHYFFAVLLAIFALLTWVEREDWQDWRRRIGPLAIVGVLALPTVWLLYVDLQRPGGYGRTSGFSPSSLGYTFFSFFFGYCLGPSLRELHFLSARDALIGFLPWLACFGVLSASVVISRFPSPKVSRLWRTRLVVLSFLPVSLAGLASQFASFGYNVRHVAWSAVPLFVFASVGLSMLHRIASQEPPAAEFAGARVYWISVSGEID
jgi:hypothetical protein